MPGQLADRRALPRAALRAERNRRVDSTGMTDGSSEPWPSCRAAGGTAGQSRVVDTGLVGEQTASTWPSTVSMSAGATRRPFSSCRPSDASSRDRSTAPRRLQCRRNSILRRTGAGAAGHRAQPGCSVPLTRPAGPDASRTNRMTLAPPGSCRARSLEPYPAVELRHPALVIRCAWSTILAGRGRTAGRR